MTDEKNGLAWKRFLEESFHVNPWATNIFDFSHVAVPETYEKKQFLTALKESIAFRKKYFPCSVMIIPEHRKKIQKWIYQAFPDEKIYFFKDRKGISYPWQDFFEHAYLSVKCNLNVRRLRWENMQLPTPEEFQDFKRKFEYLLKYPCFKTEDILKQFYKVQSKKERPYSLWERHVLQYVQKRLEGPDETTEKLTAKPPVHFVISLTQDEDNLRAKLPNLIKEKIHITPESSTAYVAADTKKIDPFLIRDTHQIAFVDVAPPLENQVCSLDLSYSKVSRISCAPRQNLVLRGIKKPLVLDARLNGSIFFQNSDFSQGISFFPLEQKASKLKLVFDTQTWQSVSAENKKSLMACTKVVLKNPLGGVKASEGKSSKFIFFDQGPTGR